MVTVPSYSGPQVAPNAPQGLMNTTKVDANTFGAQIGAGLEGVGKGLDDAAKQVAVAAEKVKQRQDANAVLAAENQLTEWEQSRLNDPNSGYYASRGMQAQGGTKRVLDDYTLNADTVRRSLTNPDQQLAFDRIASARKNAVGDAASRHEAAQTRQATIDTTNAMAMNSINSAVDNYTDPKAIEFNLVNGTRALMTAAALNGQSDDVTSQQVGAYTSKLHAAVISRMMVDQPGAAKEYYAAHADQIDGSVKPTLEANLKSSVDKDAARANAETIYKTGGSLADMLGEARKIKDTDVSDQTITRIKTMYAEEDAAKKQDEEKVWSAIVANPSYDAIPVTLDGTTQKTMRDYVTDRLTKGVITTDTTTYRDLINMASNSPEEFVSVSLPTLANKLDKPAMDYLKGLQDDVKKSGSIAVAGIRTQQEMVKGQLTGMGLKENSKRGEAFFDRVQQESFQFQKENNRTPNAKEFQDILDRMSTNVSYQGWWTQNPMADLTVEGVPPEYVDDIATSLQKKGKPLTEANIRQAYILAKSKGLLDAQGPVPASGPANPSRSSPGAPGTPVSVIPGVSDTLVNAINAAADKTGEDGDLLLRITGAESSFGKNTVNPNSSASGPFQIVGGTWDDIRDRLGADIKDPEDVHDQALAAATYLKDLRKQIEPVAGKDPSDGDLYIAWFAGAGGARNILGALKQGQGRDKVTDYLTRKQVAANRSLLYDRLGRSLTVAQFYQMMSDKVA